MPKRAHLPMLFSQGEVGRKASTVEGKKVLRSKLALSSDSIVLPGLDLVDQMRNDGITDRYDLDGGGYELDENEVCVDLFCGAGGTSEAIFQALGESPAFAVNHNPTAIGVHSVNHPDTIHLESDVFAADPEEHVPAGKSIGLLAMSPSCVHFSGARGGAPKDAGIRDQAWIAGQWATHQNPRFRPRVIIVENVREFLTWAPLKASGKIDKRFIDAQGLGSTFKEWRAQLHDAGYVTEYRILNAADYGVATSRRRLFVVARRDGLAIRFPKPTHGPRNSQAVRQGLLKPYVPASSAIDFSQKCNPIFMYQADAKKAGAVRPLADNTLGRIAAGVERFVIEAEDPFIVSYYGPKNGPTFRGQSTAEPLATLTTENRFSVVQPLVTPITHHGPGRYYAPNEDLFPTFTTAQRGEFAIISPVYSQSSGTDITSGALIPLRRETNPVELGGLVPALTGHSQMAVAFGSMKPIAQQASSPGQVMPYLPTGSLIDTAFITATGGSQYAAKPRPVDVPINTFKCDNRSAVVVPTLVRVAHGSVDRHGKRRGRGDHDVRDPLPTQSMSNEFAVVEPFLVTSGYGERKGQKPRVHDLKDPFLTFVACGAGRQEVVAASLIRTDTPMSKPVCAPPSEQVFAFSAAGRFAMVDSRFRFDNDNESRFAALVVNNNTNRLATSMLAPVPAMTTGNQQIVTEVGLAAIHIGQENHTDRGRSEREPVSSITVSPHQSIITTGLIPTHAAAFMGQNNAGKVGHPMTDPISTFCASVSHQSVITTGMAPQPRAHVVAAHMAQQNEGNVGHSMLDPVSTMTSKACQQNVVTSHMLTLRQNGIGSSMSDPAAAFCARGNHHGEVRACFVKYYGEGSQSQAANEPLDTLTVKPRFAVVQVPVEDLGLTEEQRFEAWWIARFLEIYGTKDQGNPNTAHLDGPRPSVVGRPGAILWTIEMRMLIPEEAAAASSFPDDYVLDRTADGKTVSKTKMMGLIGNAVPPGLGKAIIGANVKPKRSVAAARLQPEQMAA
ncbi:DNA cytosine methyltransferase [Sphingosinicella sp. BN140058]|uniref:DNA cytosine methyltransferase n=1 Tax=Sphingosinicella sp. BN140058 TaxID=1892855 RepID=UPI001011EE5B|nr:DNA cytosine methyltransferase [Sphingosinicella sp. BN140058]QAY80163.1 DNA cytosine methyltransferase [Sphingosinicella sp. BN140058]